MRGFVLLRRSSQNVQAKQIAPAPEYRNFYRNAELIFMRSPRLPTPPVHQLEVFPLGIKEPARKKASSLSVALKRPMRNLGAVADSSDSSFTVGSARVYISVDWTLACPSQSETFRRSLVACRILNAQVWRNQCGETRFDSRAGQCCAAA